MTGTGARHASGTLLERQDHPEIVVQSQVAPSMQVCLLDKVARRHEKDSRLFFWMSSFRVFPRARKHLIPQCDSHARATPLEKFEELSKVSPSPSTR